MGWVVIVGAIALPEPVPELPEPLEDPPELLPFGVVLTTPLQPAIDAAASANTSANSNKDGAVEAAAAHFAGERDAIFIPSV